MDLSQARRMYKPDLAQLFVSVAQPIRHSVIISHIIWPGHYSPNWNIKASGSILLPPAANKTGILSLKKEGINDEALETTERKKEERKSEAKKICC